MNMTKLFRTALTICALFTGLMSTAHADFYTHRGDTTGQSTLDVSQVYIDAGTAVPYDALTFQVSAGGVYQFLSLAEFDSAIFLYAGGFNPSAPTDHLELVNNDIFSPDTSGLIAFLFPGQTYTVVVTGIEDGDFGKYSLTIGGSGAVTAVPEPSTWLMLAFGLAAVTLAQRRKSLR